MPAPRNEAQTRFELIDPMLIGQRGWQHTDVFLEVTARQIDIVYGKGQRRPTGRTDYLLCRPLTAGTEPIPRAILEAKREGLPPEHGLQQGQGYRIGRLHHMPFVFSSNGHQFVEYDDSNSLGDFQAAFGTDAAEVDTRHPQKNARVLIATYQTLDFTSGGEDATFFLRHYPPGYFDVIVIDECHRSAWGEWHTILESNANAIQVGLTATPREIRLPETADEDAKRGIEEDRKKLADNFEYFGEPPYEYPYAQGVEDGYLAPAEIETYDIFHDDREQAERVRGVLRADVRDKRLTTS